MSAPALKVVSDKSIAYTLAQILEGNLDFRNTDKYCAHGWHPFPAKFPPQLPEIFIENLTLPNDTVLDPMLGSGTTLLEAARLGRRAVGCDIDPLALIIAETKLSPVGPGQIIKTGYTILHSAECAYEQNQLALKKELSERFDSTTMAFINYWFLPKTQLELLALIREIEKIPTRALKRFFLMVFSSVIIAKSAGVSLARDLAHTRPHRVMDKKVTSAFSEFLKQLAQIFKFGLNTAICGESTLRRTSAQKTGLPADSVDLIVTSPPYANNAIDYMRAHKFSLVWLNHAIKDLSALRACYLGHDAAGKQKNYDMLPLRCEKTLQQLRQLSPPKAAALRRYFCEMRDVICEMRRVMKVGKPCVIVVASSVLCGLDVETHKAIVALGEAENFKLAGIGVRNIDRDRRMMPARRNNQPLTQIENRMHEEYIIGLIK